MITHSPIVLIVAALPTIAWIGVAVILSNALKASATHPRPFRFWARSFVPALVGALVITIGASVALFWISN